MSPMSLGDALLSEFKQEAATTRRVLERVPMQSHDWRPHPRSMSLGGLACHLAELPDWAALILDHERFDLVERERRPTPETVAELLEGFDLSASELSGVLKGRSDAELLGLWALVRGERVIVQLRRLAALRAFVLSHSVHHRGQLSVYLRLLDVPLPQIYGPSADDAGGYSATG